MTATKRFNFTEAQVAGLIAKQDTLNQYIHTDWISQGFDWLVAVQDEVMEIRGHLGWKWWKPGYLQGLTPANIAQVKLEVIDLLHFIISDWIADDCAHFLLESINQETGSVEIGYALNKTMEFAAINRSDVLMECWVKLAHCLDMTEQEILETYTQKYVLNKFRQDHGYKTGEYVKEWHMPTNEGSFIVGACLEDNQALELVVAQLKQGNHDTTDEVLLYNELKLRYDGRLNK